MAKKAIEDLGMASLLQEKEHWDNPPIPGSATITISREDDDADDDKEQEMMVDQDIVNDAESKDVKSGIAQLCDIKLIDSELEDKLKSLCYI